MKTLKDRLVWVRDHRFEGNASAWSDKAGLTRVHLTQLLKRESVTRGRVYVDTIAKLADAADVPPAWLMFGTGSAEDDPPINTMLLRLGTLPDLSATIAKHPNRWRTSTIARAVSTTFQSDDRGIPMGGWEAALDTMQQTGTYTTDATDVLRAAEEQVGRRPRLPTKR